MADFLDGVNDMTIVSQTVAGTLALAVVLAIGDRDEGRAARVDEVRGALRYLAEHPTELPAVLTTLRKIAAGESL